MKTKTELMCESIETCSVKKCPHRTGHDFIETPENSCKEPCDVTDGVTGSMCCWVNDGEIIETVNKWGK